MLDPQVETVLALLDGGDPIAIARHANAAEVGERITDGRELPVEDREHARLLRVEHQVVDAVAVDVERISLRSGGEVVLHGGPKIPRWCPKETKEMKKDFAHAAR